MSENLYKSVDGTTVIICGGDPLPGCPESWDEAYAAQAKMNGGISKEHDDYGDRPRWRFDCGFKLDFDGPLLDVSSRFYPPKSHYGATWDGGVAIHMFGQDIASKEFDCATLEELHAQVEAYVKVIAEKVAEAIRREKL